MVSIAVASVQGCEATYVLRRTPDDALHKGAVLIPPGKLVRLERARVRSTRAPVEQFKKKKTPPRRQGIVRSQSNWAPAPWEETRQIAWARGLTPNYGPKTDAGECGAPDFHMVGPSAG